MLFTVHCSAFQRAEPGWAMFRHQARKLWAERGTSTPSSWPLLWLDEHMSLGIPLAVAISYRAHIDCASR
jgi:hypothetical protein